VEAAVRPLVRQDPSGFGGFRMEELTIADPYQDYYVGLTNVVAGHLLVAAKAGDWRYLLLHGSNAVGAAICANNKNTGNILAFTGVYQTDFTLEALRVANRLPQVEKQDYELRCLDIPPILFVAIWLHGKSDDIIIPVGNTFGRWNAYQPYSGSQMLKLLQPEAKKKLKGPAGFD
jgi:hypothetical protein